MENTRATVFPGLRYRNAPAAITWLSKAFGFETQVVFAGEGDIIDHAVLSLGNSILMLGTGKDDPFSSSFKTPAELGGIQTIGLYLLVADADAAWKQVQAVGAEVVQELRDTPYGSREFTVRDPEGYTWSAGTYDPWAPHAA